MTGRRVDGVLIGSMRNDVKNASRKCLSQLVDEQTDKDRPSVLQVQVKKIITQKLTKQKLSQHRPSNSNHKATAHQTYPSTHSHPQQYQNSEGGQQRTSKGGSSSIHADHATSPKVIKNTRCVHQRQTRNNMLMPVILEEETGMEALPPGANKEPNSPGIIIK